MPNLNILAFSDCHVSPGEDLTRFQRLNEFIRENISNKGGKGGSLNKQIDQLVCLGDFCSLDSISSHMEKGSLEEKYSSSLKEDLEITEESLAVISADIPASIPKIMCLGNHEDRLSRFINKTPALEDLINIADLYRKYRWKVVPYRDVYKPHRHSRLRFTHAVMNGMNKPVSGETVAHRIARDSEAVTVLGHHHCQETVISALAAGGQHRQAIVMPAFMDHGHIEDYAKGSKCKWTQGFAMLYERTSQQWVDTEFISTLRLMENHK